MTDTTHNDDNQLIEQRRHKLQQLRDQGQAFTNQYSQEHWASDLVDQYADYDRDTLKSMAVPVTVAGRIMLQRLMGKAAFMTVQDMTGRIQLYFKKDHLPEATFQAIQDWDLGDIVWARGTLFKTRTGELTVAVTETELVTKSLRPMPEKFHGLSDQELRYRERYLDLMVNETTRDVFKVRSQVVNFVRNYLTEQDYLEVETPMMQKIPGGATARPFVTHHNALDMELYLRVAPELYLKRLIVGGLERVFEINRNFRNEGISTRHNPEFTMLEFYQAYSTYEDMMDLTEDLMRQLTQAVHQTTAITYQGHEVDFAQSFDRLTMLQAIQRFQPELTDEVLHDCDQLAHYAHNELNLDILEQWGLGKIQLEVFEKIAEPQLINPTFVTQYPAEVSPLARPNDDNPFVTDRFEFFVAGREIANGFSELNDPDVQAQRFKEQAQAKAGGDDEAMVYDADYIKALEYGMPPTAGEGIGIDRLVMLLTDSASIRDVILFPLMK